MKNLITLAHCFFFGFLSPAQSVLSPAPELGALEIEVTDVVADDSSMMVSIKIGLDGRNIDRFYFEDEEGTIVYVREVKDTSGTKTFNCRVASLNPSQSFTWLVKVHSKTGNIIGKKSFKFSTSDRPKKKKGN